jgi:hypothetical protein
VKENVGRCLSEAVTNVLLKINHWTESVNKLTVHTQNEMLDCVKKCIREENGINDDTTESECVSTKRYVPASSSKYIIRIMF